MRRRRAFPQREHQLVLTTAAVTLLLYLTLDWLYGWVATSTWQLDSLDWVQVPGYRLLAFVQAVENIESRCPEPLAIRQVELAGPPAARGLKTMPQLYELLAGTEVDVDQVRVMRFLVEGPLSYRQFAEFSQLGPISDIKRRRLFSWVSVLDSK